MQEALSTCLGEVEAAVLLGWILAMAADLEGFKDRTRPLPGDELGQRKGWGEAPERAWRDGARGVRKHFQDKRERTRLSKGSKL